MTVFRCQWMWLSKYAEMRRDFGPDKLAGPFFSDWTDQGREQPILLLGKATAGDWHLAEFEAARVSDPVERVYERRKRSREHLKAMAEKPSSAFWRFWTGLRALGRPVIWSNLAKIGVQRGNPTGGYLQAQRALAVETLRDEITEYSPALIVIACDYAKDILQPALGTSRSDWEERSDNEFCWIDRDRHGWAALWTDHPERKSRERLELWLEKAHGLLQ